MSSLCWLSLVFCGQSTLGCSSAPGLFRLLAVLPFFYARVVDGEAEFPMLLEGCRGLWRVVEARRLSPSSADPSAAPTAAVGPSVGAPPPSSPCSSAGASPHLPPVAPPYGAGLPPPWAYAPYPSPYAPQPMYMWGPEPASPAPGAYGYYPYAPAWPPPSPHPLHPMGFEGHMWAQPRRTSQLAPTS